MPVAESAWGRVCAQVGAAHVRLLKSVHGLEDALLSSGTEPRLWSERVKHELAQLVDILAHHRDAVAPPAGLLGLIELHGRSRGVTDLIATHDRLLARAQMARKTGAAIPIVGPIRTSRCQRSLSSRTSPRNATAAQ